MIPDLNKNMHKVKLAFVVPWYGRTIPGGAEAECRRTAENLAQRGVEVEVLTTCVRELESDWGHNFYPEGGYLINGVTVRRFKIRPRKGEVFNQINDKLMKGLPVTPEEEIRYMEEMINSNNLYDFILQNKDRYYFIFIPYLFSTTYFGSAISPDKSYIIPCLHDESYAYMGIMKGMFEKVRGVIFHTEVELELAEKIYGLSKSKSLLLGVGVDTEINCNAVRFKKKYGIEDRFILYAGRRDAGKNTPLLIDYFCKYKTRYRDDLKLVLIGNVDIDIPPDFKNWVIDLGFVPLQDKYDAYAAATIFCQPSVNESFSLVIMESWLCGTPVMVNANCAVTKEHSLRSQGGLYFKDYFEFCEIVNLFLEDHDLRQAMAERGRRYVIENYNWDRVCNRYIKEVLGSEKDSFLKKDNPPGGEGPIIKKGRSPRLQIHQMLPIFSYGDAIGNNGLAIQRILRRLGFNSYIYADLADERLGLFSKPYKQYRDISNQDNILIYHYSLFSEVSDFIMGLPDKKIMIYHNITPEYFYNGISEEVARNCKRGREGLKRILGCFHLTLGVSEYNRQELEELGSQSTAVLPYIVDFERYSIQPGLKRFPVEDNCTKILHVGRVAPNKKIEDIIKVFYFYQKINRQSQLFLIGGDDDTKIYSNALKRLVYNLGLEKRVLFWGRIGFEDLVKFYKESDIYLCMSEHEGFCVPLLEGMYFNLPILAYNSTGIPYTLKDAGILINEKKYYEIAEMIHLLMTDRVLREKVIKGQRERLMDFNIDRLTEQLKAYIETVHGSPLF